MYIGVGGSIAGWGRRCANADNWVYTGTHCPRRSPPDTVQFNSCIGFFVLPFLWIIRLCAVALSGGGTSPPFAATASHLHCKFIRSIAASLCIITIMMMIVVNFFRLILRLVNAHAWGPRLQETLSCCWLGEGSWNCDRFKL